MASSSSRGSAGILGLGMAALAAALLWLAGPTPAQAGDANHRPPDIELTAVGHEGFFGPKVQTLAWFTTFSGTKLDPGSGYRPGSKVRFRCTIDGRPVDCEAEYVPIYAGPVVYESGARERRRPPRKQVPSFFEGSVRKPNNLAPGPHTVTVRATDEDGWEPVPETVTVVFDQVPPSAPVLTEKPPKRSWEHKPEFHFTASDDARLVRPEATFVSWLNRLAPDKEDWGEHDSVTAMNTWWPECPDLLTCSTQSQAVYYAEEDWYSFGEPEWLVPGLYEFSARARDAAGNRSPLTTYRFRILRGKPR